MNHRISVNKITYKERPVIKTQETKDFVKGSKDGGVEDGSETDEPLPCQVSISENDVMCDFEGLPVFVWTEVSLDENGVDETEKD